MVFFIKKHNNNYYAFSGRMIGAASRGRMILQPIREKMHLSNKPIPRETKTMSY